MADQPRRPRAPGTDVSLPPPASEETDDRVLWQVRERDVREARRPAPEPRRRADLPRVDPEPTPSVPPSQKGGIRLPYGSPWWAYLLLALISTGAGGGIVGALQRKGPSSEQIEDIRSEVRAVRNDQREILDYIRRQNRVANERDEEHSEWICRANGGPWIRGYDCGSIEIEPTPLGSAWIGPRFKLRAEWPLASRPP